MRKDTQFVTFVAEQLAALGEVDARAMFGGHGIYIDGLFCAIVHRDTLYLKADGQTRAEFESLGMQPFRPFAGKPTTMRYYRIGADLLENRVQLLAWARKAMAAARRDPARKSSGRKPASTRKPSAGR